MIRTIISRRPSITAMDDTYKRTLGIPCGSILPPFPPVLSKFSPELGGIFRKQQKIKPFSYGVNTKSPTQDFIDSTIQTAI